MLTAGKLLTWIFDLSIEYLKSNIEFNIWLSNFLYTLAGRTLGEILLAVQTKGKEKTKGDDAVYPKIKTR